MAVEPAGGSLNGEWAVRSIYGLTLSSDFPFESPLASGAGTPDLTFTCVSSAPLPDGWAEAEPDYASPPGLDEDESAIFLYKLESCLVLRCDAVDLYVWPERILCHARGVGDRYFVESLLLGVALSCWLEWRDVPVLHASAVVVGGRAAAFLADSGSGKSSIAAEMVRAGHPLLTDDVLPVEISGGTYLGHPGYPQMRVWPDKARHLLGRFDHLSLVNPNFAKRRLLLGEDGFGAFCDVSKPLACLYIPQRRDPDEWGAGIQITPVPPREALMTLIEFSFMGRIVQTLGMHGSRMGFFAEMISQVPMRRVVYPSGYDHLPRVRQAIVDDLEAVSAPMPR